MAQKKSPKKNKITPLIREPKDLTLTELDKVRHEMYLKHHYGDNPPKDIISYTKQFHR